MRSRVRPSGRRPPVLRRRALALVCAAGALLPSACGGAESPEVLFVPRVRAEFPDVSVNRATDDRLLRLGRASCSPDGLTSADAEELRQIGIDRPQFVALATGLCPSR